MHVFDIDTTAKLSLDEPMSDLIKKLNDPRLGEKKLSATLTQPRYITRDEDLPPELIARIDEYIKGPCYGEFVDQWKHTQWWNPLESTATLSYHPLVHNTPTNQTNPKRRALLRQWLISPHTPYTDDDIDDLEQQLDAL